MHFILLNRERFVVHFPNLKPYPNPEVLPKLVSNSFMIRNNRKKKSFGKMIQQCSIIRICNKPNKAIFSLLYVADSLYMRGNDIYFILLLANLQSSSSFSFNLARFEELLFIFWRPGWHIWNDSRILIIFYIMLYYIFIYLYI